MVIERVAILQQDEVRDKLHYDLICSSMEGSSWGTAPVKRAYKEQFTEDERDYISHTIKPKAHRWYLVTGLPPEVKMDYDEYKLWRKLCRFCAEYCTAYGKKGAR